MKLDIQFINAKTNSNIYDMDTIKETNLQLKLNELLAEIRNREGIMSQLKFDIGRKDCFFINFIKGALNISNSKPVYGFDKNGKPVYTIDSDTELQKEIYEAMERSKNKLINLYEKMKHENSN